MALFKRAWRLKIQIGDIIKEFYEDLDNQTSLKIEFDIKVSIGVFSQSTITIYGLTKADVAFLATNYNPQTGFIKESFVELEAGYGKNTALLFSGNIREANPDFTTPDTKITLISMSAYLNNVKPELVRESIKGVTTLENIAKLTAQKNKLSLTYDNEIPQKTISDFSFYGTPFQMIEALKKQLPKGCYCAVQNKTLFVLSAKNTKRSVSKLNYGNGLIGVPKPQPPLCVEAVSLLDPALAINSLIDLESIKMPQLNGRYTILELNHKGANRGNVWYSYLKLRKGS